MQNYPWCHVEEHAGRTWSACQLDAGTVSEPLICFAEERIAFTAINVYFLGSRNVNRNAGMLHYAVLLCFLLVCVQGLSAVPFRALASFRNLVWTPAFFFNFFLAGHTHEQILSRPFPSSRSHHRPSDIGLRSHLL